MGIGIGREEGIQKRKPYPPVGLIYIWKSIKNRVIADKTVHGRHNIKGSHFSCEYTEDMLGQISCPPSSVKLLQNWLASDGHARNSTVGCYRDYLSTGKISS